MKDIFKYINKLDKQGLYKLADKLDNELRTVCAMGKAVDPNYQKYLQNRMMLNESNEVQLRSDTDTLSPEEYNKDQITQRKKENDAQGRLSTLERKLKNNQPSVDLIPGIVDLNKNQSDLLDTSSNDIMNINNAVKTIQENMNVSTKQPAPQ